MSGMYRTSDKFYTSRPPANCKSAREAWDYHLEKGPIKRLRLLDGYWGAERENGHWDEVENTFAAERALGVSAPDPQVSPPKPPPYTA